MVQGRGRQTLALSVHFADHDICGMTDDRTADTGDIASQETDARLLQFAIALLGFAEIAVNGRDGGFEGGEFDHGVGDLACPEGGNAFVETGDAGMCC